MTDDLRRKILTFYNSNPSKYFSIHGFEIDKSGVGKIIEISDKKPYFVISAFQPSLTVEDNYSLNRKLLRKIKAAGLLAFEIIGGAEIIEQDGTPLVMTQSSFFTPIDNMPRSTFVDFYLDLAKEYDAPILFAMFEKTASTFDMHCGHYFLKPRKEVVKLGDRSTSAEVFNKYFSLVNGRLYQEENWVFVGTSHPVNEAERNQMCLDGLTWAAEVKTSDGSKKRETDNAVKRAIEKIRASIKKNKFGEQQ